MIYSCQSESVFHLFLVSYWLNVLCSSRLPMVNGVIGRRIVSLFLLFRAPGEIRQCLYEEIAALPRYF
jgi:hypothetical protein